MAAGNGQLGSNHTRSWDEPFCPDSWTASDHPLVLSKAPPTERIELAVELRLDVDRPRLLRVCKPRKRSRKLQESSPMQWNLVTGSR